MRAGLDAGVRRRCDAMFLRRRAWSDGREVCVSTEGRWRAIELALGPDGRLTTPFV